MSRLVESEPRLSDLGEYERHRAARSTKAIVDYYLALLPGVIPSQAKARLHMIAAHDGSPRPLTCKLLQRPRVLQAIRSRDDLRVFLHAYLPFSYGRRGAHLIRAAAPLLVAAMREAPRASRRPWRQPVRGWSRCSPRPPRATATP